MSRSYIPGPLPTNMGRHTPQSLRRAITAWQVEQLYKGKHYDQAYNLMRREQMMTPEVVR